MELVHQNLPIYAQNLAEHEDNVLPISMWESVTVKLNYFIHPKPVFPSLCCTFFPTVVDQVTEFGHFHPKPSLIVQAPSLKTMITPMKFRAKNDAHGILSSEFHR